MGKSNKRMIYSGKQEGRRDLPLGLVDFSIIWVKIMIFNNEKN